jgi:CHAT domain-containing protein
MRDPSAAGQALYESLIRPAQIRTKKVMLAPDGPLHLLNFATLPVRDDHGSHYWIEDAQVTIVPSFELKASAVPKQAPSLLLMGNPLAADPDFPELQSAGAEMNSIQTNLPPDITKVVRERDKARPEAFSQAKPEQFAWIHFVSHATANEQQPLESAVILSRGAYGYKLFARDVLKIPLQADLVTISACHSAGAHVYAGEGLVGFSWAFLRAGARNVIAGLWNVDDRSGAQLMADMYRELGHGASPAEALRTAQLAMLGQKNGFRKPYYWGPFETFSAVPN